MTTEQIIAGLAHAWNAGDATAWAEHFAEDAHFVDVLGRVQSGRDVIRSEHQKILDTIYRSSTLDIRLVAERALGGVVLAHTETTLSVPDGPRAGDTRAVQTKLVRDGLIVAFHNTIVGDGPAFAGHDDDLATRSPLGWNP